MTLLIRRSAATAAGDSAQDLAESIAVEDVYELLYRRGESDLAAAVTATLAPAEARAVAQRLRRLVRRATRRRFFRDYRTALRPKEAARLGLVALWYERAGAAGCRVWTDLRAAPAPVPRLTLVGAVTSEAEETERARPDALAQAESARLMPDWLAGRAGGTATYATYGAAHMAALGRVGFAVTLGRYGGDVVWRLLRDSYLQKFPDRTGPQRRTTDEAHEKDRVRAAARRLYPDPQPCVVCGAPGQERHHVNGVLAGNGPGERCVALRALPCREDGGPAPGAVGNEREPRAHRRALKIRPLRHGSGDMPRGRVVARPDRSWKGGGGG